MLKYRVYPVTYYRSWNELSECLLSLKYNDSAMRGIKLKDVSSDIISGTYYELLLYNETINHPINGIKTVTQETFLYTDFEICKKDCLFILINPSRRATSIFKFLAINSHDIISISNKDIDIMKFYKNSLLYLKDFKVKKVFYSPFNFTNDAIANISILSLNDAIEDSKNLGISLPNDIQKMSFECRYNDKKIVGCVAMNGSISFSNCAGQSFFEDILKVVLG